MKKHIVIVTYPDDPQWGTDLVEFETPDMVGEVQLIDVINEARGELCSEDFESMQDLADAAFCNAAIRLGAEWSYVGVAGTVDIDELDDPDPTEYDEEEDEEE